MWYLFRVYATLSINNHVTKNIRSLDWLHHIVVVLENSWVILFNVSLHIVVTVEFIFKVWIQSLPRLDGKFCPLANSLFSKSDGSPLVYCLFYLEIYVHYISISKIFHFAAITKLFPIVCSYGNQNAKIRVNTKRYPMPSSYTRDDVNYFADTADTRNVSVCQPHACGWQKWCCHFVDRQSLK